MKTHGSRRIRVAAWIIAGITAFASAAASAQEPITPLLPPILTARRPVPPPAGAPATTGAAAPAVVPKKDHDRWAAAVDFGFNASTGNTRLMLLTTGFRLRHRETESFKLEWGVSFRYGESRGVVVARSVQTNLSFDFNPNAQWSPYAFATIERDPFRRLDLRSNTGSGVTHSFHHGKSGDFSVSAAALYSHEGFTVSTLPDRDDARWNIQTRGSQKIGNTVRIENSFFYKPVWNEHADYNIQSVTKLSSKITQRLAMTLSHEYLKDSTPPDGVRQEDQRVQAGLTFEF